MMKSRIRQAMSVMLVLSLLPCTALAQGNHNYGKSIQLLDSAGIHKVTTVQYYDGLGRPTVSATNGLGTSSRYVYTSQSYDGFDRITRKWLPVVGSTIVEYKSESSLSDMSHSLYHDNSAYSEIGYDALDREVSSGIAGDAWSSQGKANVTEYLTNEAEEVRMYTAPLTSTSLVNSGYYAAGTLKGERSIDADGHFVTVYKDMSGQMILERRNGNNDTYFVYNELKQLRFVLSPMYQESSIKALYAYEYRYDDRGRLAKKILPGSEYQQYWYDDDNRLTFFQDARLRAKGLFRYYLYDNLCRMTEQGVCTNKSRANQQMEVRNFYDDYSQAVLDPVCPVCSSSSSIAVPHPTSLKTACQMTASDGGLVSETYMYDIRGNLVDVMRQDLSGTSSCLHNAYSFTNKVISSESSVTLAGKTFTVATSNAYNPQTDALQSTTLTTSCNGTQLASQVVQSLSYDNLGRVSRVGRGGNAGGVNYTYDLHGWQKTISSPKFSETLYYAEGPNSPCYNGNISAQQWKAGDNVLRTYQFEYDNLNRLVNSRYSREEDMLHGLSNYNEQVLEINANGSVKRFTRYGKKNDNKYGKIDDLRIHYYGNHLSDVKDYAAPVYRNGSFDFHDGADEEEEYAYDGCGALVSDKNKGIANITYDNLGYPREIQFSNGNKTRFVYTPDGTKLRTTHITAVDGIVVPLSSTVELADYQILNSDSTEYFGNFIYENGIIGRYIYDGGYVAFADSASSVVPCASFHYFTMDHLGNIRNVVSETGNVEQTTHYYPSGAIMSDISTNQSLQPKKYNGKELDRMHGLDWYDYGARNYDAPILAWDRMDPLCEKYYGVSPYVYCANNPVRYIDLDGRWYWENNGNLHAEENDNTKTMADFLGTTQKNVIEILGRSNISVGKNGKINVKNLTDLSLNKSSLYVMKADKSGIVLESKSMVSNPYIDGFNLPQSPTQTELAVAHYFLGNGEAADVGDRATALLLNTKEFKRNLKATTTDIRESDDFSVDMTNLVFHIGRTPVNYTVHHGTKSSHVDFRLFQNKKGVMDSFSDPLDVGIELPGGTKYNYKLRTVTYYFKPVK